MRMRNTKYCIVEVPSKQAFINLVRKTIPLPEALYTL